MRIVNLSFQLILSLLLIGLLIYFLTGYDSAFEADKLCHSYLYSYGDQSSNYDCDHDIETHQWILYEKQDITQKAKVVKKFRYKFL